MEYSEGLGAEELGRHQKQLLREIREKIRNFESMVQDGEQREEEGAVTDCYAIPDSAALNRILKYQSLNDRRLQRALSRCSVENRWGGCPLPIKVSVERPSRRGQLLHTRR